MYRKWTKNDIEASKARFRRLYAQSPIEYRLADILEFMRVYRISIPRYIKRTRFYRKKLT